MQKIHFFPEPILTEPTKKISHFDAGLATLITEMRETMHASKGVGLAAPQIGKNMKLAVIEYDPKRFDEDKHDGEIIPFMVIANPTITFRGSEIEVVEEGCLSIPKLATDIARATQVRVIAQNEHGERIRIRARGFLARILQHEIDHLNGLLITDRTRDKRVKKKFAIDKSEIKHHKSK